MAFGFGMDLAPPSNERSSNLDPYGTNLVGNTGKAASCSTSRCPTPASRPKAACPEAAAAACPAEAALFGFLCLLPSGLGLLLELALGWDLLAALPPVETPTGAEELAGSGFMRTSRACGQPSPPISTLAS
eukprot:CAMPEP_0115362898 /NCGR_PEP_ID=MMETSP0270-20121206/102940_1 /TAXON_ID=71861 /ORGANISM="Scrippsiella trochoidea, Strain CCMP3099" /LENGTH=130 /DNA_ID=CAMNT_0002785479 /DNA_START=233 /DNA_END=624 /DNA_ORIENTATION=+